MDCQVNYRNCGQPERKHRPENRGIFCVCSVRVIYFLAVLLAFTLGLILGAIFFLVILAALPAVVVFAITMAVLIIAMLILRWCFCCKFKMCED